MKHTYKIWSDELNFETIVTQESENMNIALDTASNAIGYIDYADLMQQKNWNSENGDGLNIEEVC
jgi:hypothetical protein